MSCPRLPVLLVYMLFISSVFCSVALMFYTYFLIQPQRVRNPSLLPQIGCTPDKYQEANHEEQQEISNINPIPLIDFKDLGSKKEKVMLLIIVSTAPQRMDRRQAIRDTWWKHCDGSMVRRQELANADVFPGLWREAMGPFIRGKVKCVFVTDGFIANHAQRRLAIQEKNIYKDMELQPLQGGREFGFRFLNQIKWAMATFHFRYLLRIDDDYFLCLKKLLAELPVRPNKNLVWGFFHCPRRGKMTWIDEAFMIFTRDIIQTFLAQNESSMLCHPHADQQIGLWLNQITRKIFFHDKRLYHDPPASFSPKFQNITNVCDSYLGVHGTYVDKMRYFGRNANDSAKKSHSIPKFSSFCPTTKFDYRFMHRIFRFEPKLCKDNPTWNVERTMFVGRERQYALRASGHTREVTNGR